jgi:hypothetical protein
MPISTVLRWGIVATSAAAAILWWLSARVPIPTVYVLEGVYPSGPHEPGRQQRIDPVVLAVRKQSRLSAAAAFFAGLAAALQAAAIWLN